MLNNKFIVWLLGIGIYMENNKRSPLPLETVSQCHCEALAEESPVSNLLIL